MLTPFELAGIRDELNDNQFENRVALAVTSTALELYQHCATLVTAVLRYELYSEGELAELLGVDRIDVRIMRYDIDLAGGPVGETDDATPPGNGLSDYRGWVIRSTYTRFVATRKKVYWRTGEHPEIEVVFDPDERDTAWKQLRTWIDEKEKRFARDKGGGYR